MVLSRTSGSCQPGNFGWRCNVTDDTPTEVPSYCPISGYVFPEPTGFKGLLSPYGYEMGYDLYLRNDGGTGDPWMWTTLKVEPAIGSSAQVTDYNDYNNTGSVDTWIGNISTDQYCNGSEINNTITDGFFTRTFAGYIQVETDGTEDATPDPPLIMSWCWREEPASTGVKEYETTGKHQVTPATYEFTPYDENEACSAYVCKRLAAENCNSLLGKESRLRSTPLLSYWVTSPE